MSDQLNLLPLDHSPVCPARDGHLGERIYLEEWAKLVSDPRYYFDEERTRLDEMLTSLVDKAGQREAHIAATFACWLGTACGRATISQAERLREVAADNCMLYAWTSENLRHYSTNFGHRLIESLLMPTQELRDSHPITLADAEVIDHVAHWFGTPEGWMFIERCERRIKFEQSEEWRRQRESMAIDIPHFLRKGAD